MRTRAYSRSDHLEGRLMIEGSTGSTPKHCAEVPSIKMSRSLTISESSSNNGKWGISTNLLHLL